MVRDVEVEARAFFLICCTLLNVLVREGKGPEGRSRGIAQGPALGPESPLVSGSPSGAKEKVSARELSPVLPPLPGLDRRLGLVSQG